MPRTLFDKVWDAHLVRRESDDTPAVLYVDLHLVHEVTSPQAFAMLRERGRSVRRADLTVATMDHSTPTTPRGADGRIPVTDKEAAVQIAQLETNCRDFGIPLHALGSERQGTGHVIEYAGPAIRALSMEERMTVCNMSIEAGARAGMIAPDDTTFEYLAGRRHAPQGEAWEEAVAAWRRLPTDEGAAHDRLVDIDASALEPMITYGTNPGMAVPVRGAVPPTGGQTSMERALDDMGLRPGQRLLGHPIDVVFIGSCTNSRLSDLRQAASFLSGRKVAANVRLLVVPGSQQVKKQAEEEGLDHVFREAGGAWRDAGGS